MATKAEIKAAIQAKLTGNAGLTTHAQHEEFLHTEDDSLLENVYPDVIHEDETTGGITVSNADMSYIVHIVKIGRQVTLTGRAVSLSSVTRAGATIFEIDATDTEYLPTTTPIYQFGSSSTFAVGIATLTNGGFRFVKIINNRVFSFSELLGPGESFFFEITYNTLN